MKNNRPPAPGPRNDRELEGRKILVGVCGGIAAYKTVELVRLLIKAGARVQVVMTDAATKFVTPLTFETITARRVYVEMFPQYRDFSPWHTELASWPDLAVVAPATANHMAKAAAGIADDLLSTIMLTLERQKLLCPSMNHRMWANPATQENLATLRRRGFRFVMPDEGQMARPGEEEGTGRLAEPSAIYREVRHILSAPQDLRGIRVLVTAGKTEESWDPVRVLTNRATGRMGFALAEEARERGADVVLVHGPTDVIPPAGVRIRRVTTAAEMAGVVKQEFPQSRIILMAAAVADYTFPRTVEHKIKKGDPNPEVHLVPTEDILRSLADKKGNRIVVGFALETENLLDNALRKLREKHLDIVVANNPLSPGSGFAGDTNQVLLIHRNGRVNELPLQSKREVAREILNAVIQVYRHPEPEPELEPELETVEDFQEIEEPPHEVGVAESLAVSPQTPAPDSDQRRKSRRRGRRGRGGRGQHPGPSNGETINAAASAPPPPESAYTPESVAEPVAEVAPELPFPAGAVDKKKGRGRRGGRRVARARSRQTEPSGEPTPVADTSPPIVSQQTPPPAQTAAVSAPAKTEKPKNKRRAPAKKSETDKPKKSSPRRSTK